MGEMISEGREEGLGWGTMWRRERAAVEERVEVEVGVECYGENEAEIEEAPGVGDGGHVRRDIDLPEAVADILNNWDGSPIGMFRSSILEVLQF